MENANSKTVELSDLFKPIRRNIGTIVILFITIVGTVSFFTATAEKVFESSAVLSIQEAVRTQNQLVEVPSVLYQKYIVQNQVAVLESRSLASRVVKDLMKSEYSDSLQILGNRKRKSKIPSFLKKIIGGASDSKKESPPSFQKIVRRFKKATSVSFGQETNIIELKARSNDPWEAAFIVNTWVKAYQDYNRSDTRDEVTQTRNFLEKKLKEYEKKLTQSEQALAKYQRENKVVSLPDESQQIVTQLANFQSSYNSTITELQSVKQKLDYLRSQLDESKKNLVKDMANISNPVLSELQQNMAELVSKRAAFEAQLIGAGIEPSKNSKIKEMDSRIQGIRQRIIKETKKLVENGLDNMNPLDKSESLITKILELETDFKALRAKANSQKEIVDTYTKQLELLPDKKLRLAKLERNVQVNNKIYFMLREKAEEARIRQAGQVSIARVVDFAQPPSKAVSPRPMLNLFFSMFFSLLLGIGVAYAREYFEDSIKEADDVESLGMNVLGSIPMAKGDRPRLWRKKKRSEWGITRARQILPYFLIQQDSYSPIAESYKSLRTTLFAIDQQKRKTVLLTSPGPAEGKSTTVANLAITIAQRGVKTLLVDSDLRRPVLDILFMGSHKRVGLTNFLKGENTIQKLVRPTTVHGLDLMPAGMSIKDAAELLSSKRMVSFIREAQNLYDMVIFDSPPVLPVSDASILSSMVDGIIVVMRAHKTTRDSVKETLSILNSVGANVLGGIITGTERRKYYRYHDYYNNPQT